MKLVKSECEKVWLFDVTKDDLSVKAGLACFLADCPSSVVLDFGKEKIETFLPFKAISSAVPMRILNARLPLQ
jgi:hypothetical protein